MTIIIAIVVVVAIVWGAVALRYGGLLVGCLAVVGLGSCFGAPFFTYEIGPLPLTSDRVLLLILGVTYCAALRTKAVDRKPMQAADLLLGLWLGVLLLSTLSHQWQINGMQPLAKLVFYFLFPAMLYWIAREARMTEAHARILLACLSGFAVYLAITAIAEANQIWWAVWPRYVRSPIYEEFYGRGRGPFLNPVACGLYLTAGLTGLLVFSSKDSRQSIAVRLATAVVLMGGVYCTLTRSIWLSAIIVCWVALLVQLPRRWKWPAGLLTAVLAGGLCAAQWEALRAFKRDEHVSVHAMSQSAGLRPVLATVAWRMFCDEPLWGHGFGQYKEKDLIYFRNVPSALPLEQAAPYEQHSVFLALLTETGMLGAGLFVLILVAWYRDAFCLIRSRSPRVRTIGCVALAGLFGYTLNGLLHDVSIVPMVHVLLFMMAGVCRGIAARHGAVASIRQAERRLPLLTRHALQ